MNLASKYYKTLHEIERAENFSLEEDMTISENNKRISFKGVKIPSHVIFHNVINDEGEFYFQTENGTMFMFDPYKRDFTFVSCTHDNSYSHMKEPDIIEVCMFGQFLYEHDIQGYILSVRSELEDILPEYVQDITEEHEMYIMMKEIIKGK